MFVNALIYVNHGYEETYVLFVLFVLKIVFSFTFFISSNTQHFYLSKFNLKYTRFKS